MALELRPYQAQSIDALRSGFRNQHTRQVLCAATGAGKSRIAESMIQSAIDKGSRVMFVCERRVLVDQMSAHLDRAGIDHGVLMASHWRFRPDRLVQVASAQTLERMESIPSVDLVILDEVHALLRASILRLMDVQPTLRVIGLTATPFHKVLGKYFSNVVNVITMEELVKQGYLVPFRVFAAKEIDTTGVKVIAGEWAQGELEKRGQQIVGDVVADYIRISHEVFGGYRKTICFSCGIAHGAELAKKFNEAGINAVQISSESDEDFRNEVLRDFARPDSDIKVVISVAILSRGFDQSDVDHVILARPLKKSFSEHVQMIGRGARIHEGKSFCIARDSLVLTDSGLVKIQDVSLDSKVWDGVNFVSHHGAVCRGVKPVMEYDGVTATPDHEVMTNDGWQTIKDAADRQLRIARTGAGGKAIRLSDNCFSNSEGEFSQPAGGGAVWKMRLTELLAIPQYRKKARHGGLSNLQSSKRSDCAELDLQAVPSAATAMPKPDPRKLFSVRRSWHSIQVFIGGKRGKLGVLGAWRAAIQALSIGQDRQQRPLRGRESALGYSSQKHEQHAGIWRSREIPVFSDQLSRSEVCRLNPQKSDLVWENGRGNMPTVGESIVQTEREVWDILSAGPLQRFTVDGRLVHNCVVQDNSGNWLRFQEEWDALYHEGVQELGQGQDAKPKKEPSLEDKEAAKCPKCGLLWAGGLVCLHCGHERTKRNEVVNVAGEMVELGTSKGVKKEQHTAEYKADWYAQLLGYAQARGYKPGYAYHAYIEKFGVGPSMAKPQPTGPSLEITNWVTHRNIRKSKGAAR